MLKNVTKITSRFSDTDAMQIVWHGNYLKYFEDGREAFGEEFALAYLYVYTLGYTTPLVHLEVDYKKAVSFNETLRVETCFEPCAAAKIIFNYEIFRDSTNELVCTGKSVQVFLNKNGELQLNNPDFFIQWKLKNNI